VEAYRRMADLSDYPLHLGVTASGPHDLGIVKSSIGIGALLLDGIGDTIRVSLTADPVEEVIAAKRILSSLNLRKFGPEIISCPTCGRCQVDLISIVNKTDNAIRNTQYAIRKKPLTIAIMGCEVNGPGEAKDADIGIAFGKASGMLFRKGKIIRKVPVKNVVKELLSVIASSP
jgi:(E)-4-hydroxy-3-methylbut-2-enyl-diphosphate synthase